MKDIFFDSYNTAEWQKKKNKILERDNYTCQICGDNKSVMQVHHISYKHCNNKAYNAYDGELITLCEKCHSNDDGDHVHFYDGQVSLTYRNSEDRPSVFIDDCAPRSGWEPSNCWELISFKEQWHDYYHIGFRTEGNWFDQVTGFKLDEDYAYWCDEFNPEDVVDINPASDKDAEKFIRIFGAKDYVYKDKYGVWKIDKAKYEKFTKERNERSVESLLFFQEVFKPKL